MKNFLLLFVCMACFGLPHLRAQTSCPTPCPPTVVYTTPDGAFLDWCEVPGVDSFQLMITDTLTGLEYGPFVTDTSQYLISGLAPGLYWVDLAAICDGQTGGSSRVTIGVIIIIEDLVLLTNPPPTSPVPGQPSVTPPWTETLRPATGATVQCKRMRIQVEKVASNGQAAAMVLDFSVETCQVDGDLHFKAAYPLAGSNSPYMFVKNATGNALQLSLSGTVVFKLTPKQKDAVSGDTTLEFAKIAAGYKVYTALIP